MLTKTTEFVTNRSPNQDTSTEKTNNAQTKNKFRHPQQNRGRKNKPNYESKNPASDNNPDFPNSRHSTLTPYQANAGHDGEFNPKETNENKKTAVVSKEKVSVDEGQSEDSQRGAWTLAWEAHVYFSGTLFVLLAAYCTVNIARLHTFSRLFRSVDRKYLCQVPQFYYIFILVFY